MHNCRICLVYLPISLKCIVYAPHIFHMLILRVYSVYAPYNFRKGLYISKIRSVYVVYFPYIFCIRSVHLPFIPQKPEMGCEIYTGNLRKIYILHISRICPVYLPISPIHIHPIPECVPYISCICLVDTPYMSRTSPENRKREGEVIHI